MSHVTNNLLAGTKQLITTGARKQRFFLRPRILINAIREKTERVDGFRRLETASWRLNATPADR